MADPLEFQTVYSRGPQSVLTWLSSYIESKASVKVYSTVSPSLTVIAAIDQVVITVEEQGSTIVTEKFQVVVKEVPR